MPSKVDIRSDESQPEGGHAIVQIRDLEVLPKSTTFQILPLEDDAVAGNASDDWPSGDLEPIDARITANGVELRIGPEIVDRSGLAPGTPVVFTLPGADIRAEISWPDLPLTVADKLPAPIINPTTLRVRKLRDALRQESKLAEAEKKPLVILTRDYGKEADAGAGDNDDDAVETGTDTGQAKGAARAGADPVDKDKRHEGDGGDREQSTRSPLSPATKQASVEKVVNSEVVTKEVVTKEPVLASDDKPDQRTPQRFSAAGRSWRGNMPAVMRPAVMSARDDETGDAWGRGYKSANIVLGAIASVLLVLAVWPSLPAGFAWLVTGEPREGRALHDPFAEILNVGDRSPAGVDASGMSVGELLDKAQLAGLGEAGKVDQKERKFWLRKAISVLLADPQTRWALTRLGALQTHAATNGGLPDYQSAKTLWELSSVGRDQVATCFIGQLYEHGLGVAKDPERARNWYQRAEALGGCDVRQQPKS